MAKDELFRMMTGPFVAQAVYTAAELGLADLVAEGKNSVDDLAEATGTHTEALRRVLRFLASHGVFRREPDGGFSLTPAAQLLRSDVPGSQRAAARMLLRSSEAIAHMLHSVKTQESAHLKVLGKSLFEHLVDHPEEAAIFDGAMTSFHGGETEAVLDAYDFASLGTLADIGGGNGSALAGALNGYPDLRGILFDQPHVIERAKEDPLSQGLSDRCRFVGGSFFEAVPSGADAYMMRHIIHDWYDEQAEQILRVCRQAIPDQGRLLIVEAVISGDNEADPAKLLDMIMLLLPGGKERDPDQYAQLLSRCGFELTRIVPTESIVSVVEARPI